MKAIRYIIANGAWLGLLYLAFSLPYPNVFSYSLIIFTVLLCILGFIGVIIAYSYPALDKDTQETVKNSFDVYCMTNKFAIIFDKLYDAVIVALFVYFGWWITGIIYFITFMFSNYTSSFRRKLNETGK